MAALGSSQTRPSSGSKGRPAAAQELLGIHLDRRPGAAPLYAQVRDGVRAALAAGSLAPGMRLPPEREMAAALGVNRTTVTRAYQELVAGGVVESHGSRGTVVLDPAERPGPPSWALALPATGDGVLGPDPTLLRDLAAAHGQPGVISFAAGAPGDDLVPSGELRTCLDEALTRWGTPALSYGPVEGFGPLRSLLRERCAPGLVAGGDEVLVVSGATQGLALAARTLVEPGDEVVVEVPGYVGSHQTFALAGARLIGVPVDRDGIRVDLLEGVLARRSVRLVIVQSAHQNPTGAVLSPARRERLLWLARRFGVALLEDDAARGLGFAPDGGPPPLKADDRAGSVVYLGTFSKTITPGIRVGWMVAPEPALSRLTLAKQFSDLNTNTMGQLVLARFLESGRYERHVAAAGQAYRRRRDLLLGELGRLAPALRVPHVPEGGLFLWARLAAGPHARLLTALAAREGLALVAGEAFCLASARADGGADRVRLCYAGCTPETAAEGVRRLAAALAALPAPAAEPPPGAGLPVV
jgi:DNA-binding transcriptional MocR family regulator